MMDLSIQLDNRPGALADMGDALVQRVADARKRGD
jgi:hypothetical protein